MLNIALFGPPGAGKGTQSEYLISKYNLYYISTGDILRKEIAKRTPLGLEAEKIMSSGGLVSDEIIVQIIEKTIKNNSQASGFLFDGFPRTYVQAYILEGLMLKLNTALSSLISIELKEEESVNRLVQRGKISGRSDDNESVIRKRLNEYRTKTIPVIDFYKERGIFQAVDGSQDIKDVKKSISNIMSKELHKELFNVIIFGYPGSGRASYAKAISEKYGLENMDMSKMLKTEIANNTLLGQKIKAHYENEETVSDEIAVQLIEEKLEKSHNANGFIFKGFPRTLVQSYILDGLLKRHQSSISMVFNLDMTAIEAIQMHDNKHITDGSMNKDKSTANTIRRFKEHEKKTLHVINKYNEQYGVKKIDGTLSFDEVFNQICLEIESVFPDFE